MSNASIRTVIEAIEAQIEAAPSLSLYRGDVLSSPATLPGPRGKTGYMVRRTLSRNLQETRNQDTARVEDLYVVELQIRVKPKDQRDSRGDLYDSEQSVIDRVTELAVNRKWNLRYMDTLEELSPGEWFKVFIRFSAKRNQSVGAG